MIELEIKIFNKDLSEKYDISFFETNYRGEIKKQVKITNNGCEGMILEQDKLFDIIDKYFKENL